MTAKWGICTLLVVGLALFAGCRTPQPVLKPEKTPERLVAPPPGAYMSSELPKEAFDRPDDPGKKAMDAKINNPGGMPNRGGMMPAGGMGGH